MFRHGAYKMYRRVSPLRDDGNFIVVLRKMISRVPHMINSSTRLAKRILFSSKRLFTWMYICKNVK